MGCIICIVAASLWLGGQQRDSSEELQERDYLVLQSVLQDLVRQLQISDGGNQNGTDSSSRVIAIKSTYRLGKGDMLASRMLDDISGDRLEIPDLLAKRLIARTQVGPRSIDDNKIKVEGVTWLDVDKDQNADVSRLTKRAMAYRLLVDPMMPGFSDDGKTAAVVLAAGPSPHGLFWVYRLVSVEGRWKVENRKLIILE